MVMPKLLSTTREKATGSALVTTAVAVAVVGILAVALISIAKARSHARNMRILSSLDQMRVIAEDALERNAGRGYCVHGGLCASTDLRVDALLRDVDARNRGDGGKPVAYSGTTFCVEAVLGGGATYCLDSEGTFTGSWNGGSGRGTCAENPVATFSCT